MPRCWSTSTPVARQWRTNLIGYDALASFGSPSYYVQKMFAENRGDTVLPVEVVVQKVAPAETAAPPAGIIGAGTPLAKAENKNVKATQGDKLLYATASRDDATGDVIVKVVNPDGAAADRAEPARGFAPSIPSPRLTCFPAHRAMSTRWRNRKK